MTRDSAIKPARPNLRGRILEGGAMLMGRQLLSMGLSLIGLLVITRIIGPDTPIHMSIFGLLRFMRRVRRDDRTNVYVNSTNTYFPTTITCLRALARRGCGASICTTTCDIIIPA